MSAARIAWLAALAALAIWIVKALAIWQAGGLGESPIEGPLFVAGFLAYVLASLALGVALLAGRPSWLRAIAGVVSLAVWILVYSLCDGASGAIIENEGWVHEEAGLWAAAALLVLAAAAVWSRGRARSTTVAPH